MIRDLKVHEFSLNDKYYLMKLNDSKSIKTPIHFIIDFNNILSFYMR